MIHSRCVAVIFPIHVDRHIVKLKHLYARIALVWTIEIYVFFCVILICSVNFLTTNTDIKSDFTMMFCLFMQLSVFLVAWISWEIQGSARNIFALQ